MMNTRIAILRLVVVALTATASSAQLIDPNHTFAWGENVGFLNWGNTPGPAVPQVESGFLSGFIWGENVGWIHLGDGNGPYANTDHTTFGVNYSGPNNNLSGYAWGENVGWINFSGGALAAPRNPAKVDFAARRLRGFVWGENIGWINLDDDRVYVGLLCAADLTQDGILDFFDVQLFLNWFSAQNPSADFNNDGIFDFFDVQAYLNAFSAGCL